MKLAFCTDGAACSATTVFYAGGPHSYVAYVANWGTFPLKGTDTQATSPTVRVSRQAWTVALAQDKSMFAAGDHIQLTATANQDLTGTQGSYGIFIMDATTGTQVASCTSGTTCVGSTSFFTGGAHTYIAEVTSISGYQGGSFPNVPGTDLQAISTQKHATRLPWTISMASSVQYPAIGESVQIIAHTNQDVGFTGGNYNVTLRETTTGTLLGQCISSPCTFTFNAQETTMSNYELYVGQNGWTANGPPDLQANSHGYTAVTTAPAFTIDLAADTSTVTEGDTVHLTAMTNQDVASSVDPLSMYIFNQTTGAELAGCALGTTCEALETYTSGPPATYIAYIGATQAGTFTLSALQGTVAVSDLVRVETDDAYATGGNSFAPHMSLNINQWQYNGDSPTGSNGRMDMNMGATVIGLGDGAGCPNGCTLKFEGGMPDDTNVIRATSTISANGDTNVLPGLSQATITADGTDRLVPDQLYLRAALYTGDGSPGSVLLADTPWRVASSLAVQSEADVYALSGSVAAMSTVVSVDLCIELFPVSIGAVPSSLKELQIACLQAMLEAPAASAARRIAQVAVSRSGWVAIVIASVGALLGLEIVGRQTAPSKTDLDQEPEFLELVARFLQRDQVAWGTRYVALTDTRRRDAAKTIIRQCTALAAISGFSRSNCGTMPIFAPGLDVREAAAHDFAAITQNNNPAQLNYAPTHGTWYPALSNTPCSGKYSGKVVHCDEYPFNASQQGGPGQTPPTSLRLINATENVLEGSQYLGFLTVCKLRATAAPFLVIPVISDPSATEGLPTTAWCGKN